METYPAFLDLYGVVLTSTNRMETHDSISGDPKDRRHLQSRTSYWRLFLGFVDTQWIHTTHPQHPSANTTTSWDCYRSVITSFLHRQTYLKCIRSIFMQIICILEAFVNIWWRTLASGRDTDGPAVRASGIKRSIKRESVVCYVSVECCSSEAITGSEAISSHRQIGNGRREMMKDVQRLLGKLFLRWLEKYIAVLCGWIRLNVK